MPAAAIPTAQGPTAVTVSAAPDAQLNRTRQPHWGNDTATLFRNPWPSFRPTGLGDVFKLMTSGGFSPSSATTANSVRNIPVRKPDFGASLGASAENDAGIKATWLGHACFLLEMPLPPSTEPMEKSSSGQRGIRILLDPVFSHRCSPSSWVGPARFTKAPCQADELPEIDVVVISHNHYDHLDVPTLTALLAKQRKNPPQLFMPLNTSYALPNALRSGYPITELDWWEDRTVHVPAAGSADGAGASVRLTATPAQHFTARGLLDRNHALWASWAIEEIRQSQEDGKDGVEVGAKVWFGGDTGYCAVADGQYEIDPSAPVCPAFKEIGTRFGGFDLGLIPIGAYDPRGFMSPIHCGPMDSVRVFQDTQCKKAVGMHWGVWTLTSEAPDDPPKKMAEARGHLGLPQDAFTVMDIGETRAFAVGQ